MIRRAILAASAALLVCAQSRGPYFTDIAAASGLTLPITYGGKPSNDYILESTGTGAAIFDYNGDGANDVFIANGTVLTPGAPATHSQLYRNDGKGRPPKAQHCVKANKCSPQRANFGA